MATIDYKNRALMLARAYAPEGTSDVELYYDRFDKVLYFTDISNGSFYMADGTPYEPSPIPDGNKLIYSSLYNGIVGLKFLYPVLPSSVNEKNWSVENGSITLVNQLEDDTLLLFTMENSDTLFINTYFENMVGDYTKTSSIAALPCIYKQFESQEALCEYYGVNGESIPEPDGNLYIDFSTQKSYLDIEGRIGVESLVGKWLYIISTSVPLLDDGTMEPVGYYYANVESTTIGIDSIGNICL
jgi:hypothetical protein